MSIWTKRKNKKILIHNLIVCFLLSWWKKSSLITFSSFLSLSLSVSVVLLIRDLDNRKLKSSDFNVYSSIYAPILLMYIYISIEFLIMKTNYVYDTTMTYHWVKELTSELKMSEIWNWFVSYSSISMTKYISI